MNPIMQFVNFLNGKTQTNAYRTSSQRVANTVQGSVAAGSVSPTAQACPSSSAQGSHHIERQKIVFRQVGPNDVVDSEEKQWRQNGGAMEGDTRQTIVITADGQLADPSKLQSVCSQCNRMLDTIIRSEISHMTLCRRCQREFEMPDGRKVICTPDEFKKLSYRFDTWAKHDFKRKGGVK